MRALQPPDRGQRREARGRDHRRRRATTRAPGPRPGRAATPSTSSLRVDRGDGFVGRNMLMRGGARVRLLHRGDRRRPARPDEVLLERRLRPPELHERPPRRAELRRHGRGRRGDLPGRGAGDRLAGDGLLSRRAARQHGHQAVRHAQLRARLLGLDGQRRAHHRQPHLRQHDRDRDRHALVGRPSRASPPTAARSTTTTSTRTTSTSTTRSRRSSRSSPSRSARESSTPA